MKLGRSHAVLGVEVEQVLLQLAIVLLAWALMRRLGATALGALLGGLTIAMHPELLLSVTKVWDVSLSTLALVLVVYLGLRLLSDGVSWGTLLLLNVALAVGCFDRANYALLLLPLAFVLWQTRRKHAMADKRLAARAMALLLLTAGGYSLLSVAVYGSVVLPGNGPYNLYAGQNELSERALLEHLNAEFSLVPSLRANHMQTAAADPHNLSLRTYYIHASIEFAEKHPEEEVRLAVVKLYTFLRADTKLHGVHTGKGMIKLLLTAPIPFWLGTIWWSRTRGDVGWTGADTFVCLVAVVYVVPFLISNSDPRFRTPLDVLAIAQSAGLLTRGRRGLRDREPTGER
jgi:hypothetical protein